jgi:U3 small nucleolar RNA-associated protein 18
MLGDAAALPAGTVAVAPLADANAEEPTSGVVRSVQFHPSGQLLLTAGLDKRLRLFQARFNQCARLLLCGGSVGPY